MLKANRPSSVLLAALLATTACQDTSKYQGPLYLDGDAPSMPISLSPSAFQLEEGESIPLAVRTTADQAIPTSQIRWSVEPFGAAEIRDGRTLIARQQSGTVRVTAEVGRATASITGTIAAVPARIEQASTHFATGVVGTSLDDSVSVLVLSSSGKKVEGARVSFEVVRGEGTLSHTQRTTGADGIARTAWTLGPKPGRQVLRATAGEAAAEFPVEAWPDYGSARARMIEGRNQNAEVGDVLAEPLTLVATDSLGNALPGLSVTWTFSSGEGYEAGTGLDEASSPLTLVTDDDGRASARWSVGTKPGVQKASATFSLNARVQGQGSHSAGQTAMDTVAVSVETTVKAAPAEWISLTPTSTSVEVGADVTFSAVAFDRYQNPIEDAEIVWRSSRPAVASIDENGVLTGESEGAATVTATVANATGRATVDVEGGKASQVEVASGNGQQGFVGSVLSQPLRVRVLDTRGNPVKGVRVQWSLENDEGDLSVAANATDAKGFSSVKLTLGRKTGVYVANASVAQVGSVAFKSTATAAAPVKIVVTPNTLSVPVDKIRPLSATVRDRFGNSVHASVTWSSSLDRIVTVDANGRARGRHSGTAWIRAYAGPVADSVRVQVTDADAPPEKGAPGTVNTLQVVSATSTTVTLRWTQVHDGRGKAANYALRYASPRLDWDAARSTQQSIGGTSVGSRRQFTVKDLEPNTTYQFKVVAYRGRLYRNPALGGLSNVASGVTESASEKAGRKASVIVNPSSVSLAAVGNTTRLAATATNQSGKVVQNAALSWRTLDSSVATVTGAGLVRARSAGTALIVVSAACCGADTTTVTVRENLPGSGSVASVTVTPSSVTGLTAGDERTLEAVVKDAHGTEMPGASVTWASSDPKVATVDATGVVTARASGTTTIRATAAGVTGSAKVTVDEATPPPPPPPPPAGGLLFSDGFETGDISHTDNGFWWKGSSDQVVSGHAHSGKYALRFRYGPDARNKDSSSQRAFGIAPNASSAPTEIWVEFYIYVPDNYVHRKDDNSSNNKLFAVWSEKYSASNKEVHVVYEYERAADTKSMLRISSALADGFETRIPDHVQTSKGVLFDDSMRGKWIRIRMHIRSAVRASAVDIWRDNTKIGGLPADYSITRPDWEGRDNYLRNGYLMGWANSGFAAQTDFYIDDFKLYVGDPGW